MRTARRSSSAGEARLARARALDYGAAPMRISLFLPHVGVFGGVRRFLELGNAWTAAGHEVQLFHPSGEAPGWLPFRGRTRRLAEASGEGTDLAIGADAHTFSDFRAHRAGRHLYYCVLEGDPGLSAAIADASTLLAANSSALRRAVAARARRPVLDGIGGIRLDQFRPARERRAAAPLRVLLNGRRSRPKKGTDLVLAALRSLTRRVPDFEVVLFDAIGPQNRQDPRDGAPLPARARFVLDPTQDELVTLYQSSHLFVAAERKAGWCNTALEAMACGTAVVCTRSGTGDFAQNGENALVVPVRHPWWLARAIGRVLRDPGLRARLEQAAPRDLERWSWPTLAEKLLRQVEAVRA
jgi:glycosyltransferase involved in cell wall biosynthesis